MTAKKIWVYILSAVIFLSVAFMGVSSVFRIDTVTFTPTVISDTAREEAVELQKRFEKAYKKESIFFADASQAEKILEDFPYFRMTTFEKAYPNRLIIKASEDSEVYAVPLMEESGYYLLGEDGLVLGIRDSYTNRLDNENNLLIKGLTVTGEKGLPLTGDECIDSLFSVCEIISQQLGGIRRNVVLVEVIRKTSYKADTIFRFTMREGVRIYIGNPYVLAEEKGMAAIEKYMSLSAEQRLGGRIAVSEQAENLNVSYAEIDEFDS